MTKVFIMKEDLKNFIIDFHKVYKPSEATLEIVKTVNYCVCLTLFLDRRHKIQWRPTVTLEYDATTRIAFNFIKFIWKKCLP